MYLKYFTIKIKEAIDDKTKLTSQVDLCSPFKELD